MRYLELAAAVQQAERRKRAFGTEVLVTVVLYMKDILLMLHWWPWRGSWLQLCSRLRDASVRLALKYLSLLF